MRKASGGSGMHKTFKGQPFDMAKMREVNGDMRALGNANLNARGDKLDSKGRIVKRRDQIIQEYYANNPNGVKYVSLSNPYQPDSIKYETTEEAVRRLQKQKEEKMAAKAAPQEFKSVSEVDLPDNVVSKRGTKKLINKDESEDKPEKE